MRTDRIRGWSSCGFCSHSVSCASVKSVLRVRAVRTGGADMLFSSTDGLGQFCGGGLLSRCGYGHEHRGQLSMLRGSGCYCSVVAGMERVYLG